MLNISVSRVDTDLRPVIIRFDCRLRVMYRDQGVTDWLGLRRLTAEPSASREGGI